MSAEEREPKRRLSAAERRERILEAATEVFAENGYSAASMGGIAARAGVVASVIYDHFGSKQELFIELIEMHGEALIARSIDVIEPGPPEEMLRESVGFFYRLVEEDPFAWRFLFRDPPSDPEVAAAWRNIHDRATAGIAELVRLGARGSGELLGIPPERAAWMIAKLTQSATNGLAQWWYENRDVPREEVVEISVELLWNGSAALLERAGSGTVAA